jgi:acetolactate synthase-1/2/3 large subunit
MPDPLEIEATADTLLASKTPMIWAGAGVLFSGSSDALKELSQLTSIPVFCTMPGKSGFDERDPLSLGSGCGTTTQMAHEWLKYSDVILALGSSLTRSPYAQAIPKGKILIQNTNNPDDINKDEPIQINLVGDTKLTIENLITVIKKKTQNNGFGDLEKTASKIKLIKERWLAEWHDSLNSDEEPISYYRVIQEINKNLDLENSIVTHDAGAPRDTIVPFFSATIPHSYIGWGKTTHLGFGIPLMIGAKMAQPEKFCLNLMGDGAFGMSGTDLETAARSGAAITTVLLNNSAMATYSGPLQATIGEEARNTYGVSTMQGDYAKIAEGMGAIGIKVSKPDDIGSALKEAQEQNKKGKTVLIEVEANIEQRRSKFQ